MATQLKLRRGTTTQHSTFTGASGEVTVDTTKKTLVVHDGSTAGGQPLLRESQDATVQNLTISGSGKRITGDFSNATIANRVTFQTSTSNSASAVGVIPSGTANYSGFFAFNSSTPDNSSYFGIAADGTTGAQLKADKLGTGSYLPMTFYTGGSERMRIDTGGNVGIGAAPTSDTTTYKWVQVFGPNTSFGGAITIANSDSTVQGQFFNNNLAVYFGSATNHPVIFRVNGTEVLRLGSAGQIGLIGANFGTSGQVLTSQGSGAAPVWGNAPAPSTTDVLNATAGAAAGDVGTYALLATSTATASAITAGGTLAGSSLRYFGYCNPINSTAGTTQAYGATPAGTWRAMGTITNTTALVKHTLFLRIS